MTRVNCLLAFPYIKKTIIVRGLSNYFTGPRNSVVILKSMPGIKVGHCETHVSSDEEYVLFE